MKIEIQATTSAPEPIQITKGEYNLLARKAALYDAYKAAQRQRANTLNQIFTPEQRSERCRKAALARWNKRQQEVK